MKTEKNINVENADIQEEYVTCMGLKMKKNDYERLTEASKNRKQDSTVRPKTLLDLIKERDMSFNWNK
jgi:hypothetical protein